MPAPSINTSYNNSINDIGILSQYITGCDNLESKYQYLISEVVMIRLFATLELTIEEMALKIACGAQYKNATAPLRHENCTSVTHAHHKMLTHNRGTKIPRFLKWTNAHYIENSIKYVLDTTDKFFVNINTHGALIDEMRIIRNHAAHKSSSTARDYYQVLRTLYGGNPKIPIGAFLISTSRNAIPNIKRYLSSVPVILNDISKG